MKDNFKNSILNATHGEAITKFESIQSLWSGYGEVCRVRLQDGDYPQVVVKHVTLPDQQQHPRGWNTPLSHQRKIKSYHVESNWYRQYAAYCDDHCRVPRALAIESGDQEFLMIMEDIDASGYQIRKTSLNLDGMDRCLSWLAEFHATFMGRKPTGLWEVGTYWHLETRPDELEVLNDSALKAAAPALDHLLRLCPYQTLVHGDAKLANFCFSDDLQQVAAVDFQYVGGGVGVKDVAYFIGSCLDEAGCKMHEKRLLDSYFNSLEKALVRRNILVEPADVEQQWRSLFPVAWTDFHRFIKGWSPGHWKIHGYSETLARQVLKHLPHRQ